MSTPNVLPFGPRDSAVDRQEIVDTLHRMLDSRVHLAGFPTNFRLALRERVWESERIFAGGTRQGPVSFHDFIHEHYPVGLGASYDVVENLIRGDIEALALWTEVTKRKPGNPTGVNQHSGKDETGGNVDNVNSSERPAGNSKEAGLRRLQKEASAGNEAAQEHLENVKAGKESVHAACVAVGFRKSTKVDCDVKQRCAKNIAEWIISHAGPNDDLSPIIADLFACGGGAKTVAIEIKNMTGESVMDRRYGP